MGRHMPSEEKNNVKNTKAGLRVAQKKGQKKKKKVSVKNQMRSLQRLLNKEGLNPKLQMAEDVKLEALKDKHEQHKQNEKDRQLAKRYHMAKFFERIKIERMIEKAKREVAKVDTTPEAQAAAKAKLAHLQEDRQYVMHFPKGEKFVSLLRNAATPEDQILLDAERARLRGLVRRQVADDMLLSEANEGRQSVPHVNPAIDRSSRAQAAVQQAAPSKTAPTALCKGKDSTAVSAKSRKAPSRKVEAAAAEAPRSAEGNMAEEDDFFMQSGDEGKAPEQAQPAQAQAPPQPRPEVRQSPGNATAARPGKSQAWSKPPLKAERRRAGPPRQIHNVREVAIEPQAEKTAPRSRAEGGRKRRKKAK